MGSEKRTGFILGLEQLVKDELLALKTNEFMSLSSFMTHYGLTSSRINPVFYKLEMEGFMQSNNIEVAYYSPRKNLKTRIYIKK